jgi:6-phosphogluconolactonase
MHVYVGAITSSYVEPKPPLYLRPEPLPREGNMGEGNPGILVYDLDPTSGTLTHLQTLTGLRNPSYLALHPTLPLLYAGERETTTWGPVETIAGNVTTVAIGDDGRLSIADRVPSPGGGTYVSIHPAGTYLFTAMPSSRTVMVWPLDANGRVGPATDLVQEQGRGVNLITLGRPFPHSVRPDVTGARVMSCDMGLDRLMVYDLDPSIGKLSPAAHPYAQLSSGAGPRHFWVHPNNKWVYTANETDATVSAFAYDAETSALRIIATVSLPPDDYEGHASSAQIVVHPSGQFLYASLRGPNRIAQFAIDQASGRPRLLGLEPTQGQTPRNFNVDPTGRFLIVGNIGSGTLVTFRIDQASGRLTPTGQVVEAPNPACIMFRA